MKFKSIILVAFLWFVSGNAAMAAVFLCSNVNPGNIGSIDQFYKARWSSDPTYRMSTNRLGLGYPERLDSGAMRLNRVWIQQAAAAWSGIPGSRLDINVINDDSTQGYNNGQNEIHISPYITGTQVMNSDYLAVTLNVYDRGRSVHRLGNNRYTVGDCTNQDINIVESDIIINQRYLNPVAGVDAFLTGRIGGIQVLQTFGPLHLRRIIMHEFGHGIGLGHENRALSMMMPASPMAGDIGPGVPELVTDDLNGLIALYGQGSLSRRDLAVSRWGCCTTSNRINRGREHQLYWDNQKKVPRGNTIRSGDSVFSPLTVYNLGGRREDVQIDIFLKNVSTGKEVLLKRSNFGYLSRGRYKESMQHFYIPQRSTNFSYGQYRLGWRVDPRNLIPSSNFQRTNNESVGDKIYTFTAR